MSADIDKDAYLWTSGEWHLFRQNHEQTRVVVHFRGGTASAAELVAIRQLTPELLSAPIASLRDRTRGTSSLPLDECGPLEAQQLAAKAQKAGLDVRLEDTSYVSHLPIRTVDGETSALLIDDDEEAELVVQKMLEHGVPVTDFLKLD